MDMENKQEENNKEITKEIIITSHANEVQVALLEDKKLMEIHTEKSSAQFSVGDIYLGKVKKIMPGLNAAFVDVGSEREAFLHYLDLGINGRTVNAFVSQAITTGKRSISRVQYLEEIPKNGKISDVITTGQQIMVQVAKEPISTKGPRITTEISFAGRYLVLVPFSDKVSVSQKIKSSEERKRLRTAVQSIRPRNFGIIIRTVAENKPVEELSADLDMLRYRWDTTVENLFASKAPLRLAQEENRVASLLRDFLNDSFHAIHVDTPEMFTDIKNYLHVHAPEQEAIVSLYNEKRPIFDHFNVSKQIKGSFGKVVTVKNGVYLIIEHTEAMHVIDVNSGNRVKSSQTPEQNALNTNMIAAQEIARQLRLRDMGGIITIDFVDLHDPANKSTLNKAMTEFMRNDKAKHTILPLNKFGLMQITRQRVRPAMDVNVEEECPTCHGSGKIKSSILFTDQLESKIDRLVNKIGIRKFYLHVHPYVAAYINKGVLSLKIQWQMKYGLGVHVVPSQKLAFLQYEFYDSDKQFIDMQEEIEST